MKLECSGALNYKILLKIFYNTLTAIKAYKYL